MSENGYADAPWEDAPEETLPPEGEYDLRIVGKEERPTKGSSEPYKPVRRMIVVSMRIEAAEDYQGVQHFLVFPNKDEWDRDDEDAYNKAKMMLRNIRRFLRVFGINETDFNPDDLDGATGRGTIRHEYNENDGENYPRLRLPRAK